MDQSGKTVQSNMLTDRLLKTGIQVKMFSFPDYTTDIGLQIRECLDADTVEPRQIHTLLAKNRKESLPRIQQALDTSDMIIMNRYCESNIIYGIVNGLDVEWLESLDSDMPKSDMVILLDIPAKESFKRKRQRDTFETNLEFMEKIVSKYKTYAKQNGWHIINGTARPNVVHDTIWNTVRPFLKG